MTHTRYKWLSSEDASIQSRGCSRGQRVSEQHFWNMTERDTTAFTLLPTTTEQKDTKHNSLRKLYCRNGGYHLRIQPNATVDASRQENDVYSKYADTDLYLFIYSLFFQAYLIYMRRKVCSNIKQNVN